MRIYSLIPKSEYVEAASYIGEIMPAVGQDQLRGGWYDVVERMRREGEDYHRFAFHDRKAWWQQEQAILAYLILHGIHRQRGVPAPGARGPGLLQRVLPGPRRGRGVLQRAR